MAGTAQRVVPPGRNWFTSMPPSVYVVISGMTGGLVFWVLMRITGVNPFGWKWYAGIPTSLLLGGVAAFLGVYLFANSDTSKAAEIKHTLAFALVCGVVWSPIIDTAKQTVLSAVASKKSDSAKDSAGQLGREIAHGTSVGVEQEIAKTAQTTSEAVKSLSSVTNDDVRQKLISDSQDAVATLVDASQRAPDASIGALSRIGKEAAASGDPAVTRSILDGLQRVQTMSPAAATKAEAARQEILTSIAPQPR